MESEPNSTPREKSPLSETQRGMESEPMLTPREKSPLSETQRGMELEPMLTPREKSSLSETQSGVEPATLHHDGERARHTTDRAIPVPICLFVCFFLSLFRIKVVSMKNLSNGQRRAILLFVYIIYFNHWSRLSELLLKMINE